VKKNIFLLELNNLDSAVAKLSYLINEPKIRGLRNQTMSKMDILKLKKVSVAIQNCCWKR
jgi:hypothetical protein